ncbi:alpha/beta hydrolase fold domain-containing protein [Arthrobacter koreensis]|uniref:alpha/beta hydrolase fold domain-containing protein n=1 Tax=Arthrobacter koreensis TaxID=199136 RepID=UPI002DBEF541|nr:alpha/beta hydrolase fold domain-containing protein [Arthrobacter koreensis]MEB7446465.1 alpha/beta hydrolase [Arthrobacter koreensis]
MSTELVPPPYDREIAPAFLAKFPNGNRMAGPADLNALRKAAAAGPAILEQRDHVHRRDEAVHVGGNATVPVSVIQRSSRQSSGPVIFHTHGGGMVAGNRWSGLAPFLQWVDEFDATLVTVDYRLAPEHPDPVPRSDAYAAMAWAARETAGGRRFFVAGQSAGGGIAAGLALMARDLDGPRIDGQLLLSPMLDDRNSSVSALQFDGTGGWDRGANAFGWESLLGPAHAREQVPPYAAPARAQDLSGLPPAFLECGTAEVFRDETMAYAGRLWEAGNDAELHLWAGGFHRYDQLVPDSAVSKATLSARTGWLQRRLNV